MTALQPPERHPHPPYKLMKIARHRVLRWFRPPEAELRRARHQPHPMPAAPATTPSSRPPAAKEGADEQHP